MMRRIRNALLAGLLVLLPVFLTYLIFEWLLRLLDGVAGRWVQLVFGRAIPGLGAVITIMVVLATGFVTANLVGRRLVAYGESLINRAPLVRTIYQASKQIVGAFSRQDTAAFKQVVLVEYPRRGVWSIAFLTGELEGELPRRLGKPLVSVLLPTTPNPTSGFLLIAPRDEVIFLDMPVSEGFKLVISGGLLSGSAPVDGSPRPPAVASDCPTAGEER
ncbi:MAG TPA: DUF502 domain-containing protein [Clostridiales bacterium]|nr:DUF502 domain-containing protein [Clostridiales bacterium]